MLSVVPAELARSCLLAKAGGRLFYSLSAAGALNVQFGIGSTSSLGSIKVQSPVGEITFHIVKADTPFLLCLKDMDRLGIYFNNLDNKLIQNKISFSVIRQFGHPFLVVKGLKVSVIHN
jgi:hypothetical protein